MALKYIKVRFADEPLCIYTLLEGHGIIFHSDGNGVYIITIQQAVTLDEAGCEFEILQDQGDRK